MSRVEPIAEADGYTPQVIAHIKDGIGWMVFSNPRRRNAVTFNMWRQIPDIIARFAQDDSVRVVALRGEGTSSFISGADISEFAELRNTPEQVAAYDAVGAQAGAAIAGIMKPTVAVIRTWCVGGGLGTALGCDLRIAAEDTGFAVPAAKLGLGYRYAGIKTLVDIVGPANAAEIFYSARQYTADEALRMGLINRILPADGFDDAAESYLRDITRNAPLTMKAVKMALRGVLKQPEPADLREIDEAVAACFQSEDYAEGRAAFAEKRPPEFKGR
ncbi:MULTISPECIES: enoyl-CoA hydratase [Roseobacteraceae]|uniref:Short-chain-enoyl-CoA hydratase n=1 Tax=Pseudosulfitobacter pseudonitzschiae TaxID=1402135 RepID=A0A221JX56_9RHOB|nr:MULTISPECIES: enoyl-CoA hydratase [Roseobacteraceae]ASM71325.1 short-chain-enoyl-CoA hydratase [Pseudosulfitobacter pseudonitzschiae]